MGRIEDLLREKLARHDITPHENLGQHFLTDPTVTRLIKDAVSPGAHVIEIGAGPGNLTAVLAEKASTVTAVEIDPQFGPILMELQDQNPKIDVQMGDALNINWKSLIQPDDYAQVVANIPYHITEPLLGQLAGQPIDNAVLLMGANMAHQMALPENSEQFGRMSLLTQTYFSTRKLANVGRAAFFPVPGVESTIVELTPKVGREIASDPAYSIFARLFSTAIHNPMVINVMKEVLLGSTSGTDKTLDKRESMQRQRAAAKRQTRSWVDEFNQTGKIQEEEADTRNGITTQAQALSVIARMELDSSLLRKPFLRLDNPDIRRLVQGIRRVFRRQSP